jgi:hypothetical protein
VRFAGEEPVDCVTNAMGRDFVLRLAHRAFCASAILRRDAADTIRFGWIVPLGAAIPFKDSIPEIISSNFSISTCARVRFSRSSRIAFPRLDMFTPSGV